MQQLEALRAANVARQAEWCPDQIPDLSFRGNELAGETGEACNVIKKLERERQGWAGSRASLAQLAEELADVIICVDLVAQQTGIDLWSAVVAKFNATSEARGLGTMLADTPACSAPSLTPEHVRQMVRRFLQWKLPQNFCPDGGISFEREFNTHTAFPARREPIGTNLLDATQAEAMVRHMLDGLLDHG